MDSMIIKKAIPGNEQVLVHIQQSYGKPLLSEHLPGGTGAVYITNIP